MGKLDVLQCVRETAAVDMNCLFLKCLLTVNGVNDSIEFDIESHKNNVDDCFKMWKMQPP